MLKLIMLGAPGAGKGTQAAKICERYNIPTISTGAIIRNAIRAGSEMGLKAKSLIDKGLLVPDEVVISIIDNRLKEDDCKNGYILDGFPRTLSQAQALKDMGVDIDYALSVEVDDSIIIDMCDNKKKLFTSSQSPFFSYDAKELKYPDQVGNSGIYHSTGYSAAGCMWMIQKLLDIYEIDRAEFVYSARSYKKTT